MLAPGWLRPIFIQKFDKKRPTNAHFAVPCWSIVGSILMLSHLSCAQRVAQTVFICSWCPSFLGSLVSQNYGAPVSNTRSTASGRFDITTPTSKVLAKNVLAKGWQKFCGYNYKIYACTYSRSYLNRYIHVCTSLQATGVQASPGQQMLQYGHVS